MGACDFRNIPESESEAAIRFDCGLRESRSASGLLTDLGVAIAGAGNRRLGAPRLGFHNSDISIATGHSSEHGR